VKRDAWIELNFYVELPDDETGAADTFNAIVENVRQLAEGIVGITGTVTVVGAETRYQAKDGTTEWESAKP
jgi:hypothetical protein